MGEQGGQIQVLLHTAVGLVFVVPYGIFQVRHFLTWYQQRVTAVMVLGYALAIMVVACTVSGLVLTWESAFGLRRTEPWEVAPLVGAIALFVLVLERALSRAR